MPVPVPNIKLNSGYEMPQVGFGLWKVDNATCADTVYNAIKAGYRLFDGACGMYNLFYACFAFWCQNHLLLLQEIIMSCQLCTLLLLRLRQDIGFKTAQNKTNGTRQDRFESTKYTTIQRSTNCPPLIPLPHFPPPTTKYPVETSVSCSFNYPEKRE